MENYKISWEELYGEWKARSEKDFPEFQRCFKPRIVELEDFEPPSCRDCFSAEYFSHDLKEFRRRWDRDYDEPFLTNNSRFILNLLLSAKTFEEIAAIWIYAFTEDLINSKLSLNENKRLHIFRRGKILSRYL